ncbi:MAG: hypothetical protein IRY90_07040, partial [Actinomadura rubrobrunea]|nr:hypothetical protein [Actinomadura rubrobrunea]
MTTEPAYQDPAAPPRERTVTEVAPAELPDRVAALLAEHHRPALVAAHHDPDALRVVYLFTA